jgi:formylglycine-generating enzyme required for sulfatase activity
VTLVTDPPGAEVRLMRFEEVGRRLVPVDHGDLGKTPLQAVSLPHGSWLLAVHHPDRAPVAYPIALGRQEHWDGVAPGERDAFPVVLPWLGELAPGDCYVPAGWFRCGGDAAAAGEVLPGRRLWCDALVVRRFPVTNAEYLGFLDALQAAGHEDLVARHVPRDRSDTLGADGPPLMTRGADGRYALGPDLEGDLWQPDWPVLMVSLASAAAFAAWRAGVDGLPWRVPGELEWEKAARGVDGRPYPWGAFLDPTWARHGRSATGRRLPVPVTEYPVDCSVYGVRCTAGTVQEWTADRYFDAGPPTRGDRVVAPVLREPVSTDPEEVYTVRGSHWFGPADQCRVASRLATEPINRGFHLGFRVVRSL